MILNDAAIRTRCNTDINQLIQPFNENSLNPASYDLSVGNEILIETVEGGWYTEDISDCTKENPWYLTPGEFILAHSMEKFHFPTNVAGFVKLKSSRAREGYEHLQAGWCDPGWHDSVLTMEIKNITQYRRLPIYPGLKIVQMVFVKMVNPVGRAYMGKYNGIPTVSGSLDL